MPLNTEIAYDPSEKSFWDFSIELSGRTVTVKATTATLAGKPYALAADESYTADAHPAASVLAGYLVEDTGTKEVHVAVDEFLASEAPHNFLLTPTMWVVTPIFVINVPANAADLSAVTGVIYKRVAGEKPRPKNPNAPPRTPPAQPPPAAPTTP